MGKGTHKRPVNSACPMCRSGNRRCTKKNSTDRCLKCNHQLVTGRNDTAAVIRWALPYPEEEIESLLRQYGWQKLYPADSHAVSSTVHLDIKSIAMPANSRDLNNQSSCEITFEFCGSLTWDNTELITSLDAAVHGNFSVKLKDKFGDSSLVQNAALIGGYLYLLRTAEAVVPIQTARPNLETSSRKSGRDLAVALRHVYMWRARQLIDGIMYAIRREYANVDIDCKERNAYAAVSILKIEVSHFIAALKHGPLSSQIPSGLEGPFLGWLISLDIELRERLIEGCGRLSDWQSVVLGSMKSIRRQHTLLSIHTTVQHSNLNIDVRPQLESNIHGQDDIIPHANMTNFLHEVNGNLSQNPTPDLFYEDVFSPYDYQASPFPLDNSDQSQHQIDPVLYDFPSGTDPFESLNFEAHPPLFEGLKNYNETSLQNTSHLLAHNMDSELNVDLDISSILFFCHSNGNVSHPNTVLER